MRLIVDNDTERLFMLCSLLLAISNQQQQRHMMSASVTGRKKKFSQPNINFTKERVNLEATSFSLAPLSLSLSLGGFNKSVRKRNFVVS